MIVAVLDIGFKQRTRHKCSGVLVFAGYKLHEEINLGNIYSLGNLGFQGFFPFCWWFKSAELRAKSHVQATYKTHMCFFKTAMLLRSCFFIEVY
jgi:hypothetical protein